jgi:hypothetical protein
MVDENLRREIVTELRFDWLAFDQLADLIARHTGAPDPLAAAVEVTVALIHQDLIRPGTLTDAGFVPWPGTRSEQAIRLRAESQWYATLTHVDTGDICWFDVTVRS